MKIYHVCFFFLRLALFYITLERIHNMKQVKNNWIFVYERRKSEGGVLKCSIFV